MHPDRWERHQIVNNVNGGSQDTIEMSDVIDTLVGRRR
jgi:hypothetical protein